MSSDRGAGTKRDGASGWTRQRPRRAGGRRSGRRSFCAGAVGLATFSREVVGEDRPRPVEAKRAARRSLTPSESSRSSPRSSPPFAPLSGNERDALRRLEVRQLVDRPIEVAEQLEPLEDVAAAVPARRSRVPADREHDVTPRRAQLERRAAARSRRRRRPGRGRPGELAGGGTRPRAERVRRAGPASGTCGTSASPVATTTLRASQRPALVSTRKPTAKRSTRSTSTPSTTGASNDRA